MKSMVDSIGYFLAAVLLAAAVGFAVVIFLQSRQPEHGATVEIKVR